MDLYDILGLDKDADLSAVKRAYRALSKTNHPDKGGDPTKFHNIHLAYKVLSDPKTRKKYDETGEIPGEARNTRAMAIELIRGEFQKLVQSRPDLDFDVLVVIGQSINDYLGKIRHAQADLKQRLEQARRHQGRFKGKLDTNPMRDVLNAQERRLSSELEQAGESRKVTQKALALLREIQDTRPPAKHDPSTVMKSPSHDLFSSVSGNNPFRQPGP